MRSKLSSTAMVLTGLLALAGAALSMLWGGRETFATAGWGFFTSSTWDPGAREFGAAVAIYGTLVTATIAMIIAVPTAQFRSSYLFYAQTGWKANYVDIIAPDGSATTVDGVPVNNFKVIGATGYSLAHVKLSNAGDGSHNVMSDKKVGITVYGVVDYGSYWYPGGLDLDVIPQ